MIERPLKAKHVLLLTNKGKSTFDAKAEEKMLDAMFQLNPFVDHVRQLMHTRTGLVPRCRETVKERSKICISCS